MLERGNGPLGLLLHPGALGDGLLALPSMRRLARTFPEHRLLWCGQQQLGAVLMAAGEVHAASSFDSFPIGRGSMQGSSWPDRVSASRKAKNFVVGWLEDDDGFWLDWAAREGFWSASFRSPHDRQLRAKHMSDRYAECLEDAGLVQRGFLESDFRIMKLPISRVPDDETQSVPEAERRRRLVLLHPGSGGAYKCVKTSIFVDLTRQLARTYPGQVGIIEGPADGTYVEPLLARLPDLEYFRIRRLDLLSICDVFRQTQVFIGHDSGLSHLAATCGVHSLLLFGPSDPEVWAPRGSHVHILQHPQLDFSPDVLCEAIDRLMKNLTSHLQPALLM